MYEDNEEEYEAYYDYTKGEETQLVQHDFGLTSSGYELVISGPGKGSKIIGSRELLRCAPRWRPSCVAAQAERTSFVIRPCQSTLLAPGTHKAHEPGHNSMTAIGVPNCSSL